MHICFVTYWGLEEGLTQATVIPHLEILQNHSNVSEISLISMERGKKVESYEAPKTRHFPVYTDAKIIHKIFDKRRVTQKLRELHRHSKVDVIMARGGMAAMMCMDFAEKHNIPMSIESFEPHAQYMLDDGVWKRSSLKYKTLYRSEERQKKYADFLLPVTDAYRTHLIESEGVKGDKIITMPCCVNEDRFGFLPEDRQRIRELLKIEDRTVGVYTGKLGGIYLEEEAIAMFQTALKHYKEKFYLIILSPDKEAWESKLSNAGFSSDQYHIGFVPMSEVPAYLSAADYAYSLHRPTPSKMGISPIKNAEYFANGLPVIMPTGIGDDSALVPKHELGVVVEDFNRINEALFDKIDALIPSNRTDNHIVSWAKKNRSFAVVAGTYDTILSAFQD